MSEPRQGIGPGQIIRRSKDGSLQFSHDELTKEEPLEIRIGRKVVATTMRTPGHDEELAVGFLITEGIICDPSPVESIERPNDSKDGDNVLVVTLRAGLKPRFSASQRLGTISSSCGICGKRNIEAVRQAFAPIPAGGRKRVSVDVLLGLSDALRKEQGDFARTGGIHAAGLFDFDGNMIVIREDIGRHNAVDKVIGRAFLDKRLPLAETILVVSGRASFEIMQKALAGGVPIIASVSAPSALAMDFAREAGQTLIGFLRPPTFNLYSHVERIILGEARS
jgi:FdhD protein